MTIIIIIMITEIIRVKKVQSKKKEGELGKIRMYYYSKANISTPFVHN